MGRRRGREQKRSGTPPARRSGWNWRLLLFLAGVFAVKAVVLAQLQHHPLLEPGGGVDSAEYSALARRVLGGDLLLGPGLYYLSPLYVYFLAALLSVSDSFTFVRVVQIALGTAAVWCVFAAARVWFGTRAAWIAAALAALTGVFTFYEVVVFQSSIDAFLTSAALACLAIGLSGESGSSRRSDLRPEGRSYLPQGRSDPPQGRSDVPQSRSELPQGRSDLPQGRSDLPQGRSDVPQGRSDLPQGRSDVPQGRSDVPRRIDAAILCAGLIFGLQVLNRPNVAIAIAGVLLVMLVTRRWRTALWLTAGAAIALAPVAVRNAIVTHDLAITSSQGGLNFYIGNHAGATGQYVDVPGVRANMAGQSQDTRSAAEAAVGHSLTDADVSSYFARRGLTWMREHPADAAKLFVRKLALTFNARHQWLDFSYPYYARDTGSILGWLFVGPWLLVPLGFFGGARRLTGSSGSSGSTGSGFAGFTGSGFAGSTGSGFAGFWIWFSFLPFYALSVAVFFVAERYRLPLFVPLCVLSGGGVDGLLRAFRKRTTEPATRTSASGPLTSDLGRRAWAAIALGAAGVIVTAWPFQLDDGRYEERLRLSKVLMNQRDYGGAATELEQALAIKPGDPTTEFQLGMALLADGRAQEGIGHVRRAVDAGVPIPGARYALANAMLTTGDRDGAVALLRTYYPAPDETAESCLHVAQLALGAGAPLVAERYLQRALQLRPGWPEARQLLDQLR